ncbi:hypothetical protein F4861DRAFT_165305 [Xylaria intraflava]|nr:hypothetical protein F4861DRAFT_165305 [Xylaria intraflava]
MCLSHPRLLFSLLRKSLRSRLFSLPACLSLPVSVAVSLPCLPILRRYTDCYVAACPYGHVRPSCMRLLPMSCLEARWFFSTMRMSMPNACCMLTQTGTHRVKTARQQSQCRS